MLEMEENKGQYEEVLSGFESEDAYKLWDEEFERIKEDLVEQQGFVAVE